MSTIFRLVGIFNLLKNSRLYVYAEVHDVFVRVIDFQAFRNTLKRHPDWNNQK
jgi:hypothetical protein